MIPRTLEEAEELLWNHLKERLTARESARLSIGDPQQIEITFMRRSGVASRTRITGDISLNGEGIYLISGLLGVWPDDLTSAERAALPLALDAVAELVRLGVLRHGLGVPPHLYITRQGQVALQRDELGFPAASDRRVEAFRAEFTGVPDFDVMIRHLAEAVAAYRANLDLSATVMIGCCYELALLQIVCALAAYKTRHGGVLPGANAQESAAISTSAGGDYVAASRLEKICEKVLSALCVAHPQEMAAHKQWIDGTLRSNFEVVRLVRNDAGHPTGEAVSRDEVSSYIVLFSSIYRRVRPLTTTIDTL